MFLISEEKSMDVFCDKNMLEYKNIYWYHLDFKLCYFCEFHDALSIKKKIPVFPISPKPDEYPVLKKCNNGSYDIYLSKIVKFANCIYKDNSLTHIKFYIHNFLTDDPYQIFGITRQEQDYLRNYKYYFKFIKDLEKEIYLINNNRIEKRSFGKYIAMRFYLAVKATLENSDIFKVRGYVVSEPNVFIKENKIEYDVMLLKKNTKINQGIYDAEDVVATIELKSGSMWTTSDQIIEYLKNEMFSNKPHIFIVGYETLDCLKDIAKVSGIFPFSFCTLDKLEGKERSYHVRDDQYNQIDKLLEKIF